MLARPNTLKLNDDGELRADTTITHKIEFTKENKFAMLYVIIAMGYDLSTNINTIIPNYANNLLLNYNHPWA